MLDDAAYFAAISTETKVLLLTKNFNIKFLKPVSYGIIEAIGKIVDINNKKEIVSESHLYNNKKELIGYGNGNFVKSKILLKNSGYCSSKIQTNLSLTNPERDR